MPGLDATIAAAGHRRFYRENGFTVFRNAIPVADIDELAALVRRDLHAYQGNLLRHDGKEAPNQYSKPDLNDPECFVTNALAYPYLIDEPELVKFRESINKIFFGPSLAACFYELEGFSKHILHSGILFFCGPLTDVHNDSWSCETFPPGHAKTAWIALEDLGPRSGGPFVFPWTLGLLPSERDVEVEFPPPGTENWFAIAYELYQTALFKRIYADGATMIAPLLHKGDVIVWSTSTPHGSLPANPFGRTRLSLQGIYRPENLPWGDFIFENGKHICASPARETIGVNENFLVAPPSGLHWPFMGLVAPTYGAPPYGHG
jgi:hypothetical protein